MCYLSDAYARVTPRTMQLEPHYTNVVNGARLLSNAFQAYEAVGIARDRLILDPEFWI